MTSFRDLRLEYRTLIDRIGGQLPESCPELDEETRVGFAVQIADAAIRSRSGRSVSGPLHEIAGHSN